MSILVNLENITKKYGDKTVLSRVNFALHDREIAVIHGASGSGKSTLLNIIGLLDFQSSGKYCFNGEEIKKRKISLCNSIRSENIGFIFQSYCLIESLSVKNNILLPFLYSSEEVTKETYKRMERICCALDISELINSKANVLSGGEKQRVAIARAMIKNPKLIIADEPTGNLDDKNTDYVIKALQCANDEGSAIIIVTHNMHIYFENSSIYELKDGCLYSQYNIGE